ncbi:MAG: FHA domain-containing protein [Verrucomicrobia bacterium]|nr:FHA domain-containing protein [Verrucomicrobiota bacterium]
MSSQQIDTTIPTFVTAARRDRDVRPHSLSQIEGPGAPQEFPLDRAEMILGRAEDADVRVASQRASRHHATLTLRGGEYTVRDQGSRNGVLLNGLAVHAAVLHDGDVLQLADCVFIYREG